MDNALQAGIEYSQFWEMSYQEIEWVVDAYLNKRKRDAKELLIANYQLAANTALFAALAINGKNIPKFETVYPELFEDTLTEEEKEHRRDNALSFYQLQFEEYAKQHNAQRRKEGKV